MAQQGDNMVKDNMVKDNMVKDNMVKDNVTTIKLGTTNTKHLPKAGDVYKSASDREYFLLLDDSELSNRRCRAFNLKRFTNCYSAYCFTELGCVKYGEYITTLKLEE